MATAVIGKNSQVYLSINRYLKGIYAFSHLEIERINFEKFAKVWLFSWSHKDNLDNLRLLEIVPLEKCVFISTTAVMSLGIRHQWNNYPNWKAEAERIVLGAGGRVVRLGVINEEVIAKSTGTIPVTTLEAIADLINGSSSFQGKLTTLAEIERGGLRGWRACLSKLLYRLACRLPSRKLLQLPLEAIAKLCLRSATYGYSADSARFFTDRALVGYGVLGSAFYRNLRRKKAKLPTIVVSPNSTEVLTENGFRGTRVGKYLNGLATYWHGVHIEKLGLEFVKKVPIWVRRYSPPRESLKLHVSSLTVLPDRLRLLFECDSVSSLHMDCNSVVLAAGPLENCKILQGVEKMQYDLSDHEIGMVGTVSRSDKEVRKLLRFGFGLMWGRCVHFYRSDEHDFVLDFRPHNRSKHQTIPEDTYNDSTLGILSKLIKRLSLWEINEAVFNKFGIALATDRLSAFIQIKVSDCIIADGKGSLRRERLHQEQVRAYQDLIAQQYHSFQADDSVFLFDGQHILGAQSLLESTDKISDLISAGKLVILGSPTTKQLSAEHHTVPMLKFIE